MAEQATLMNIGQGKPAPGIVRLLGRVQATRRHEKSWYISLVLPAPDAFAHPSTIEVRADSKLGEVGEDIDVLARIGGFNRKPYRWTDKDSGESRMVTPNNITLTAI